MRPRRNPFAFSFAESESDGPDVTPLLDVVFILLIFFIVAAAFAVRGLEVDLPPAVSSRPLAGKILELRLAEDGSLSCEGQDLEPDELPAFLRHRAETDSLSGRSEPRRLVLRSAAKAPVADLIRVMDIVRSLGGEKLIIATGHGDGAVQRSSEPQRDGR